MANELITIARKDYSNAIKCFDRDTRDAIDRAIALGNEFAQAHNEEAKRLNIARAVAIHHIAQDQEAVEKAGYTKFKDLASDLFGMKPELATNYRKAAEQFYCNDKAPACRDWWGPTTLYLFCAKKIDNDTINAAIEAGKLKQDTTNEQIKAWIASLEAEALEDGKPEIAKLYDGEFPASIPTPSPRIASAFVPCAAYMPARLASPSTTRRNPTTSSASHKASKKATVRLPSVLGTN